MNRILRINKVNQGRSMWDYDTIFYLYRNVGQCKARREENSYRRNNWLRKIADVLRLQKAMNDDILREKGQGFPHRYVCIIDSINIMHTYS